MYAALLYILSVGSKSLSQSWRCPPCPRAGGIRLSGGDDLLVMVLVLVRGLDIELGCLKQW